MDEFSFIEKYLVPLAAGFPGSLNLTDDAAVIDIPPGKELVITKDAISAGVHFIGNESPDLIARKLLRVNLSDLAAKGAVPLCYFIAACLPERTNEEWVAAFTKGLALEQKTYGTHLAGGDTCKSKGPLSLSLTALGLVDKGTMLKRSGAKPDDDIYVSGTLGEAALGLALLQKKIHLESAEAIKRYQLPEPRLALGQALVGVATSCMDVSDGLMQDLGHICRASNVGADIERTLLPLPQGKHDWQALISGGDDYELLFTAPQSNRAAIKTLSQKLSLPLNRIGSITAGNSVRLLNESAEDIPLAVKGWRHF